MNGAQEPRIFSAPKFETTLGDEACELAKSVGLEPDPWQALVIHHALGQDADGRWSAFEVGVNVPRQNGKGGLLEIRELAGLFLLEERLIIHSAHQFDTSLEAFRRLLFLIEESDLSKQVKRVSRSHGEEGIELTNGCRIRFRTRTKGGGRGFSCDCLILDEAMFVAEFTHGALLPTLSARPNSQVWYTGSAVDQMVHDDGIVFARVRERGLKGNDASLAYFEFSAPYDENPDHLTAEQLSGREAWAQANPGLGIRIREEHVEHELRSMDPRGFAVERLGVGDWPPTDKSALTIIPLEVWQQLTDVRSQTGEKVVFAFDVAPSRTSGAIAVASRRPDGKVHAEVVDHHKGTGWMVERLAALQEKHQPASILCDKRSPAASLLNKLEAEQVRVTTMEASDQANACATFYDLVDQGELRHLDQPMMRAAIQGARQRPLGDAWAWTRSKSTLDIAPLVAVTEAVWGVAQERGSIYSKRGAAVIDLAAA